MTKVFDCPNIFVRGTHSATPNKNSRINLFLMKITIKPLLLFYYFFTLRQRLAAFGVTPFTSLMFIVACFLNILLHQKLYSNWELKTLFIILLIVIFTLWIYIMHFIKSTIMSQCRNNDYCCIWYFLFKLRQHKKNCISYSLTVNLTEYKIILP